MGRMCVWVEASERLSALSRWLFVDSFHDRNGEMANMAKDDKNEVYMLEQQQTNEFEKPVPMVQKQDYSGAHEVRVTCVYYCSCEYLLTIDVENRSSRDCTRQETRSVDHAHAVVHVLAQLPGQKRHRPRQDQRSRRGSWS